MKRLVLYLLLLGLLLAGCNFAPVDSGNMTENSVDTGDFFNNENVTIVVIPTTTDSPTEIASSDADCGESPASESAQNVPTEPPTDIYGDGVPVPEKPK